MSFKIGNNNTSIFIGTSVVSKIFQGPTQVYSSAIEINPLYIGNIGVSTLYIESSFAKINNLKLGLVISQPYNNTVVLGWAKLNVILEDVI